MTTKKPALTLCKLLTIVLTVAISVMFLPSVAKGANAGSIDTVFATNIGTGANYFVNTLAKQVDGKILVGGEFNVFNGTTTPRLLRLNSDGTLDTSFAQTGAGIIGSINTLAVQSDGKILVGGNFNTYNVTPRQNVLRLNTDGTLDPSFWLDGTGLNGPVTDLALLPSGQVLLGGTFTAYNGSNRNRIGVLNSDGSLNSSFNPGSAFDSSVYCVAVGANGDIWAGGAFTTYQGVAHNHLVRLSPTGMAYAAPSSTTRGLVYDIYPYSGGAVLTGGNNVFARYTQDGLTDPTFSLVPGGSYPTYVFNMGVQPDGKILVAGRLTPNGFIGRYLAGGAPDTTYNSGERTNANVNAVLSLGSQAIYGGQLTTIDSSTIGYLVKLTGDPILPIPVTKPGRITGGQITFNRGTAKFKWRAPTTGGTPTSYTIRISKPNSKKYRAWKTTAVTMYKFSHLLRGSKYRVQIKAANSAGFGSVVTTGFRQKR